MSSTVLDLSEIDAVIFDTDGVVTDTASVHGAAWKKMFDEYLKERVDKTGEPFIPFDITSDYLRYVDGKPRYDGVQSFLESRQISLSYGHPSDSPDDGTVCGLGNRKNGYFVEYLKDNKITPFASTVSFIKTLKENEIGTAVISASRNCAEVLQSAGVLNLFDVKVDGVDSDELGLKGKPEPDIFLEAANRLQVKPERAAVVEDALAGVEAGKHGHFGLVIGVDRTGYGEELKKRGADIVVRDLAELTIENKNA